MFRTDFFGHQQFGERPDITRLRINLTTQLTRGTDGFLGGGNQRFIHSPDQDITADALLSFPKFQDGQKIRVHNKLLSPTRGIKKSADKSPTYRALANQRSLRSVPHNKDLKKLRQGSIPAISATNGPRLQSSAVGWLRGSLYLKRADGLVNEESQDGCCHRSAEDYFPSMQNEHSVAGHWAGGYEEPGLRAWVEELRARLEAPQASLGLVFLSPRFFPHAAQILELLRIHARIPLLAGCSSTSLICDGEEIEDGAGLVLGLYSLPGAKLQAVRFQQEQVDESSGPAYWHLENGIGPEDTNGWLCFADPFQLDCESWLRGWNEAYAPLPILGGLASSNFQGQSTQVYLNGEVFEDGGVAISFAGDVLLDSVISQGCTPIGDIWTITKAEGNVISEIGNRPACAVLAETLDRLTPEEQENARGNLFIGLVMNEYLEEYHRGDFLIRNLMGADLTSGTIAVAAWPRIGQTIQFQRRAASAGTEDIVALLTRAKKRLAGKTILGGCLCSCNGRGQGLFGQPNHDASQVQRHLGPLGLAGFFCNGEIGPVGEKNFLHGYTASLALFVNRP
jgi:small ligand-binding sensory domain FIST